MPPLLLHCCTIGTGCQEAMERHLDMASAMAEGIDRQATIQGVLSFQRAFLTKVTTSHSAKSSLLDSRLFLHPLDMANAIHNICFHGSLCHMSDSSCSRCNRDGFVLVGWGNNLVLRGNTLSGVYHSNISSQILSSPSSRPRIFSKFYRNIDSQISDTLIKDYSALVSFSPLEEIGRLVACIVIKLS